MKRTDMDYQQVIDFTGFERRWATQEEVDLLVEYSAAFMFNQKVHADKIPLSEQPAALQKLIEDTKSEWIQTAYVLDFKSVGKRLVIHCNFSLSLLDHEDVQKFLNNAAITPIMIEENSNVLGEEFKQAIKKSSTLHNHLAFGYYCALIDADNKVIPQGGNQIDICLLDTQKKIK
jgi:hypothetical protein